MNYKILVWMIVLISLISLVSAGDLFILETDWAENGLVWNDSTFDAGNPDGQYLTTTAGWTSIENPTNCKYTTTITPANGTYSAGCECAGIDCGAGIDYLSKPSNQYQNWSKFSVYDSGVDDYLYLKTAGGACYWKLNGEDAGDDCTEVNECWKSDNSWRNLTINCTSATCSIYDFDSGAVCQTFTAPYFYRIGMATGGNGGNIYMDDIQIGNLSGRGMPVGADTTPPTITIVNPENISYASNVSILNYTFIDTDADKCWFTQDAGVTNTTPVTAGTNFTDIITTGGYNLWEVYCNDTLNNVGNDSVYFYQDELWYDPNPYANKSFRITDFVMVDGDNFTLAGEQYRFLGTDSYYLADYAMNLTYDDDGNEINNSKEYVLEILNEVNYMGFNVVRTWAGMSCGEGTNWNRSKTGGHFNCFEIGVAGNYSEEMFKALDWVIYEASKRDIRLQLVLINNWDEYGGMNWYTHQSPTTNKTYENITDNSDSDWDVFHDQFYTDPNCRSYFRNYTNYTLNRINTYSGIAYKDDPAIFSWMLVNEPRAKTDGVNRNMIINWTTDMVAYVKSIDTNHLVALGIEGLGYNETWGEGTDIISAHNGTGVDYATFAIHPSRWNYFAERSETSSDNDWVCSTGSGNCDITYPTFRDFWAKGSNYTYNNRYASDKAIPNYIPQQSRHSYDNWVTQNTKWVTQKLGIPILLQEMSITQASTDVIKDEIYEYTISNFYQNGGDGLLYWTFNHDNYYYSTLVDGDMDDRFAFYLTDDPTLKTRSASTIKSIDFAKTNNTGGTSWIRELNDKKYNFVVNIATASDKNIINSTLHLNISNGTWRRYDEVNSSKVFDKTDFIFTYQFNTSDIDLYWYIESCTETSCYNTTLTYQQLNSSTPVVSLSYPTNHKNFTNYSINFDYNVTNNLDIVSCDLYINGTLNQTDTTVTKDINQTFGAVTTTDGYYEWYVKCKDIDDNIGTSSINYFNIDSLPIITLNEPADTTSWIYDNHTSIIFNFTATDNTGFTNCSLWGNFTGIWQLNQTNLTMVNGANTNFQSITLNKGNYGWNVECWDNAITPQQNWGNNNFTLTITNPAPTWDEIPNNLTLQYFRDGVSIDANATDPNLDIYYLDDTTNFTINTTSGLITNKTFLAIGQYIFTLFVNDSSNNINSTRLNVTYIDTLSPQINLIYPINGSSYINYSGLINLSIIEYYNISNCSINDSRWVLYNNISYTNKTYLFNFINLTNISLGYYHINLTINDTFNNYNYYNLNLNITETTTTTTETPLDPERSMGGGGSGGSSTIIIINQTYLNQTNQTQDTIQLPDEPMLINFEEFKKLNPIYQLILILLLIIVLLKLSFWVFKKPK